MESILGFERGPSFRGLGLHDGHERSKKEWVQKQLVGRAKSRRAPFAVDLPLPRFGPGTFDRREEKDSPEHNGHRADYGTDGVGLGRSPAIHRGSPRFPLALTAVIDALWEEGALARVLCDAGKRGDGRAQVEALRQWDVGG